jgi:histidinol-phosphatase (PHP family)
MDDLQPVSIHGGHSGQFCSHAKNTLEEIVLAYIRKGYSWVGITEHMPPVSEHFVYPEEKRDGQTERTLTERFAEYITTSRRLQAQYAKDIQIYVGFESETYCGSLDFAKTLIDRFSPDYVVGSAHHVADIPFDYSEKDYQLAADHCGGIDGLYHAYFDQQYEMIAALKPRVVGHLDIIRIYDADYRLRLTKPSIWEKIIRNLELIKRLDLILDFNLRPLTRGESEPYLSAPILEKACAMDIDVIPGDDSHGVQDIGATMQRALDILKSVGLPTSWRPPFKR